MATGADAGAGGPRTGTGGTYAGNGPQTRGSGSLEEPGAVSAPFRRITDACDATLDALAPPWDEGTAETVFDGRVFVVERVPAVSPETGETHMFTRLRAREWVSVVALLPGGDLVLVAQRRHGVRRAFLEFPAGLADEGEDPAVAAMRELREETGLAPGCLEYLGAVYPSPAFLTNRCHFFRATGCVPVSDELNLDENEELTPVVMSTPDFEGAMAAGQVDNSMCVCAWAFHTRLAAPADSGPAIQFITGTAAPGVPAAADPGLAGL